MKNTENKPTISPSEQMVIDLIRAKKFQNITIHINDGNIVLVRREETFKPTQ